MSITKVTRSTNTPTTNTSFNMLETELKEKNSPSKLFTLGVLLIVGAMEIYIATYGGVEEMPPYDYSKFHPRTILPRGPKGYLCTHGAAGRLNNIIIHERKALYLAWALNRTLVASQEWSNYYDVGRLSNALSEEFVMVVPYDRSLCPSRDVLTIGEQVNRIEDNQQDQLSELVKVIGNRRYVTVSGWDFFYKYPDPPNYFTETIMRNLYIRPDLEKVVDNFLQQSFGKRGFIGVHLRDLEGGCSSEKCNPTFRDALERIQKGIPKEFWALPIFLASDHQRMEIERTYKNKAIVFMGECKGTACAVIDFEVLARSSYFIGTTQSTVDVNVDLWRRNRQNYIQGFYFDSDL